MGQNRMYFAHPVNSFNTSFEKAMVKFLLYVFPGVVIENPNQPHHQTGYRDYAERFKHEPLKKGTRGMRYYHEVVLPSCDRCAALPFLDGRLGLGVADEARWYLERGMRTWFIDPVHVINLRELERFIENPLFHSDPFQVRCFTEQEKALLLNVDPNVGSWLVVPHEETRLRTYMKYGKEMRPYEIAHLVKMPVPEGFYQ